MTTTEPKEHWRDNPAFVEWVESLGKPIPDKLDAMATAMVGAMWLAWNAAPTRKLEVCEKCSRLAKEIADIFHAALTDSPPPETPDEWAISDKHPAGKIPKRATLRSLDARLTRVEKALECSGSCWRWSR